MRILVDIDGFLANFNEGYRRVLGETSGRWLIPEGEEPSCWNYAQPCGYTQDEDRAAWAHIHASRDFWETLAPLPGAERFLRDLGMWVGDENWRGSGRLAVYFATSRQGPRVKDQTERWLINHGYFGGLPTVLINTGSKGDLARALAIDSAVDDKPENLFDIRKARRACRTILRRARYNAWAQEGPDSQQFYAQVETPTACLDLWRAMYQEAVNGVGSR